MHKYNGESLPTYEPRGPWTQIHQDLSSLGSVHIDNVHILANLEPFRYGSPDFIQKSVQAMHAVHGANGLHLYPQASYWDWPYTADKLPGGERLKQTERDWIWYKAWGRYAWKANRERNQEISYWSSQLDNTMAPGVNRPIFWKPMSRLVKYLPSCSEGLASPRETGRPCCWGCS